MPVKMTERWNGISSQPHRRDVGDIVGLRLFESSLCSDHTNAAPAVSCETMILTSWTGPEQDEKPAEALREGTFVFLIVGGETNSCWNIKILFSSSGNEMQSVSHRKH